MIRERTQVLLSLHATHAPKADPYTNGRGTQHSADRSDEEIIERLRAERNGKFDRLWRGDLSDYGHDHSDADDGFVHKVWSYTQDEEQVRRIHAMSVQPAEDGTAGSAANATGWKPHTSGNRPSTHSGE